MMYMQQNSNSARSRFIFLCLCLFLFLSAACNRKQPESTSDHEKRYSLKGTIVSIDKNAGTANISNEPIKGFMDSMVMPYTIKPPDTLNQLQTGDSIAADVVVEPDKYWLENVKVVGHSASPAGKPSPAATQ
jgi:Cu/Ag efflux protein CusF